MRFYGHDGFPVLISFRKPLFAASIDNGAKSVVNIRQSVKLSIEFPALH